MHVLHLSGERTNMKMKLVFVGVQMKNISSVCQLVEPLVFLKGSY